MTFAKNEGHFFVPEIGRAQQKPLKIMMLSTSKIAVRYAETDQMGVVHHSHYPVYFEQARTDFFVRHLRPYQEFETQGLFAPILSYSVDLEGPLKYGDILSLEVYPLHFQGLRVSMGYKGTCEGRLVVTGMSAHALTGPDLKPLHPRKLPELYNLLKERFLSHLNPDS